MKIRHIINNNYWIKSGLLSLFQNIFGVVFGFVGFYFLIRLLTKEQYGTYVLFLATVSIIELTRNGLLQNAIIKFISGAKETEKQVIAATAMLINIVITVLLSIIMLILGPVLSSLWDTPEITAMLNLYIIAFFISGIQMFFNSVEQAYLNFKGLFYCSFFNQIIGFAYISICFFFDIHIALISLVLVTILSTAVGTIPAWLHARHHLPHMSFKLNINWMKKMLNYGKYAMGTSVNAQLSSTIDQMMLGGLLSPAAAGKFNIALRISNLANIPSNAMATIVFPQGSKRAETEGNVALKYLYEKSVGSILAILVPALLFIYLLADPIIHFVASEKYIDAIPLLKITLFYSLFIPFSRQTGTILESVGKTKLNFYLVLFTGIFNLLLNFGFISLWGVLGAAYATLVTNFVFFGISQYFNRKLFNISMLNPWIYAIQFYPEIFKKIFPSKTTTEYDINNTQ